MHENNEFYEYADIHQYLNMADNHDCRVDDEISSQSYDNFYKTLYPMKHNILNEIESDRTTSKYIAGSDENWSMLNSDVTYAYFVKPKFEYQTSMSSSSQKTSIPTSTLHTTIPYHDFQDTVVNTGNYERGITYK